MTAITSEAPATNKIDSKTTMNKAKENAFSGAADILGSGIDALFADMGNPDEYEAMIDLDDIEVIEQVREEFEDDENSLAELGASMEANGQLQAILIRPIEGGAKPFRLVAGERRFRSARLRNWKQIRSRVRPMTDEEAEDAQFAENIQRKNLTQIEEAKKVQRDLDRLGSVDAVLEKHQKSRSWLSKVLSLLNLSEQAKRLVLENVSSDLEVINTVKTIEKADPEAAKELVEDLKQTRGKANARDKVAAVKEKVKPSKSPKKLVAGLEKGLVATAKDRSDEEPGEALIFASAKSPMEALADAYMLIFESGSSPKMVLDTMDAATREDVEAWLQSFYDAGKQAKDAARMVIQGFRNGQFASDGDRAFALVAFLQGVDSEAKFSLLNILRSVKE